MPTESHDKRPDPRQDTALPDLAGWDAAPSMQDVPWHPELPDPRTVRREWFTKRGVRIALTVSLAGIVGLFLLSILIPYPVCGCSRIATNETAAVQNLKALATAQAQYIKKNDFYAISGKDLNQCGTLIARDLKDAFETWQNNGDAASPAPKAGYIYRMLQSDTPGKPLAFYNDPANPGTGMATWAVTCRPAELGVSGENQYYITEAGTVYKMADPPEGDPRSGQFLLDCAPAQAQTSWTIAK